MDKFKKYIKKICERDDFLLIIISLIFGLAVYPISIARDDILVVQNAGNSVGSWLKWAVDQYYYWSSRQIINFVWAIVVNGGRIAWMIYMSVSMFVMLKGMELLFPNPDRKKANLFMVFLVMLFPFSTLVSAGWIATSASYFSPQAFGVMALVPIAKVYRKEKIKLYEFAFYFASLIYATNAEQMSVAITIVYLVAVIYFVINHNNNWHIFVSFAWSAFSIIYMFRCPGNHNRDLGEISMNFPTYNMLGILDKADIGLSTTLHWLFFESNILVIAICGLLVYIIWAKYKITGYRILSSIPFLATILFGPFKSALIAVYPQLSMLLGDVNYYGEFNVETGGVGVGPKQFVLMLLIVVCIMLELILVNDKVEGFIVDITLACTAIASRAMMGFSPTVYASNTRTYTSMVVFLMILGLHVYNSNYDTMKKNYNDKWECLYVVCILLSIANLVGLVSVGI